MVERVLLLPRELVPYRALIEQAAAKERLDPALLAGVLMFESTGNPHAINPKSGATGLGQVMPREAGYSSRPTQKELLDPTVNVEWSARILADGVHRYGDIGGVASYLGAVDPKTGQPTMAADANGTTGVSYVRNVLAHARNFGYSGGGEGGAPSLPRTGDGSMATENPKRKTLQDQYNRKRSEEASLANEYQQAVQAQAALDPTKSSEQQKKDAIQDVRDARARLDKHRESMADLERQIADIDAGKGQPSAKSQLQNFGSSTRPDWRYYDADTDQWVKMEGTPTDLSAPDKPDDPSLVAQREAAAGRDVEATRGLALDNAAKKRAAQIAAQMRTDLTAILQEPDGPERTRRLNELLTAGLAIEDPDKLLAHSRQLVQMEQQRQRDEETARANAAREAQDTATLEETRRRNQAQEQFDTQRLAEQERDRLARGAQAIGSLESSRQTGAARALGEFEQSGVATPGRLNQLRGMMQPLGAGQYAAMLGLSLEDPRVAQITQAAGAMFGGPSGGTPAQQPQPSQVPAVQLASEPGPISAATQLIMPSLTTSQAPASEDTTATGASPTLDEDTPLYRLLRQTGLVPGTAHALTRM